MPATAASCGQQLLQQPEVAEVLAVGGGVLADQHQLADPLARPASLPRRAGPAAGRETNAPRKAGIAQNVHRRSQPDAILSGATRPPSSRGAAASEAGAGRQAGRQLGLAERSGRCRCPGSGPCRGRQVRPAPAGGRDRQQPPAVPRLVRGPRAPRPAPHPAGPRSRRSRRSPAPGPRAAPRPARRRTARPGSPPPPPSRRLRGGASSRRSSPASRPRRNRRC